MDFKLIPFHILLGVLALCAGGPSDGVESSTSTSISVSTVTRKVTSRSFSRSYPLPNVTQTVTEDMLRIQSAGSPGKEEIDTFAKPLKIKKKILASNLKSASEKEVFPGEKVEKVLPKSVANVTEAVDAGKANPSSYSTEDEVLEDLPRKSKNITEVLRASYEGPKRGDEPAEGRSLEDRSSEENVNVKAKTKAPSTTTVRSSNAYSFETFGGLQKVLNNNYLSSNSEGYQRSGSRPSPSTVLPAKKPPPISRENSLKNTIRFESEYYGASGQTDWVPIMPDKLPVQSPTLGGQHFGSKLKPPVAEKLNKTSEKNSIMLPSDGAQPLKELPATGETESERMTSRTQSRDRISTTTETLEWNVTQAGRLSTKFRGAVKFKPLMLSSSSDKKMEHETTPKENKTLENPATGASWNVATSDKYTGKPAREGTTEISIVSSTNHTIKSQNAGLAVPPENVKMENVTKEPQNVVPALNTDEVKQNKSELVKHFLPKMVDEGMAMAIEKDGEEKNETDTVNSGSGVDSHRNEPEAETASPEVETTPEDVTTEDATETTPELITFPKLLSITTETSSVSSQSERDEVAEEVETTVKTEGTITASEASLTLIPGTMDPKTTSIKSTDAEAETSTEEQSTTITNFVQSYIPSEGDSEVMTSSTQRTEEVETGSATLKMQSSIPVQTTSPTTREVFMTTPKLIKAENVTRTAFSVESTSPKPKFTVTTPVPSIPAFTGTTLPSEMPRTSSPTPGITAEVTTPSVIYTTIAKVKESNAELTEEGIHYKNYIPTTRNPQVEITEENVPAYLRLTIQAKDWDELCRLKEDLRKAIIKMLGGKNVSAESVHFLNLSERSCQEKIEETKGTGHNGTSFLPVNMFLMDKEGNFDKNLSEAFLTLWGRRGLDFELPIRKVDFVTPIVNLTELAEPPLGGSVVAAIVISCVAGICVILLGVLFVIMKRRQKRFNYGQRCTPVSLDAYSLDSVSIYNSVRRKDVRASKRSYGNAAFDDPEVPTHTMNFAGLANFSSDKEQLHEEFNIIPQVYPKVEELPAGAETKNRYANIIPLPETRVHLSPKDGDPLSYYINANYVRGLKGAEKVYIACQAPLESTVEDFWRMVWEQQCKVILMLTDLQENGIEKCADYLPPNEVTDNLRLFGDFQVTLKKRDVKEKYIISNLKLKNMESNLWREVTHLWYLGWPDQGVPPEANSLIAFLIEARSQMKIQNGTTTPNPTVIHCSPGTGRTGTVIACDLCIREYEQSRMVDIPRCVFNLRRDRAGAVQTKEQYAFIYQVLNVYATKLSGGGIESI